MSSTTTPASTNRACMLHGPSHVEITDRPVPVLSDNEVLIKVESTGLCGSDLHNYIHGGYGAALTEPLALGHESAGVVHSVGKAVTEWKEGDKVAIEPTMFCRKCHNCKTGRTNVCRYFRQASLAPTQGMLTQYYATESDWLVPLPEGITWEEAGCIQPLAVAVQLAKRARFSAGQTLAVFGCGPLGCLVIAVARAYGVSKIIAFDVSEKRVEFVKSFGADYAALSPRKDAAQPYSEWAKSFKSQALASAGLDPTWGVDIVVEASGAEPCLHAGMEFVRSAGTYVQAGLTSITSPPSFPAFFIAAKEIDVIGTVRYTAGCFETAIELMRSGKINLKPMITKVVPLTQAKEALEAVRKGDDLKVVVMNQL